MKEALLFLINGYRDYHGTGMYFALYLIAMIYIWKAGPKEERFIYVYPNLLLLAAIWNPIVTKYLWMKVFDIWTIPRIYNVLFILVFIAYAMTLYIMKMNGIKEKIVWMMILSVIIIFCGTFKFSDAAYSKAENIYRYPDFAINMSDTILEVNGPSKIAVPYEIAHYFRSYTTDIKLLYGENATYGRIDALSQDTNAYKAYEQILSEDPDLKELARLLREESCDFVVFDNEKHDFLESPENHGLKWVEDFSQYSLYRVINEK